MHKQHRSTFPNRGRYFLDSLSSAACILFVAFLIFFWVFYLVYHRTEEELTKDIIAESSQSMMLSAQEISSSFVREWQLMTESNFVSDIRNLLQPSASSPVRYARLRSLRTQLNGRFAKNSSLFHDVSILLVTDSEDSLCSLHFISDNFRADYEAGLFRFDELNYDEFIDMIESCSVYRFDRRMFTSGNLRYSYANSYSANAGYYVYRYSSVGSSVDANGQIYAMLQIDLDSLKDTLCAFRYAGDYFMISDQSGVLFTTDERTQLTLDENGLYTDGITDTIYLRTFIDNLGFTCFISIDGNTMYESIDNFRSLLQMLSYAFSVLAILIVILLFLRWHYPVIQVAQRLNHAESQKRPIDSIDSHISTLVQENTKQARQLQMLEPAAQNDLLRRFYLGRALSERETGILSALIPFVADAPFRCLLLGCLDAPAADRSTLSVLWEKLFDELPELCTPAFIDGQLVALLRFSAFEGDSSNDSLARLQTSLAHLNADCGHTCAIGISDVYIGLPSIPAAYAEAHSGWIDALNWQNASIVFMGTANSTDTRYNLRYSQLEELYYSLSKGNQEQALAIFDDAVSKNFEPSANQHLRQLFCQQFFFDIQGVVTRLSTKYSILPVLNSLQNISRQLPIREQLAALRSVLQECSELILRQAEGDNSLLSQIQSFCAEHYTDPSFSLSMVAAQFYLSESNLSKLFKTHTGVTFSSYVENMRIRNAEKLLLENKLSVKAIASHVGYANTATFYNAFRRSHNCTPTQWMEMHAVTAGNQD